MPDHVAIAVPQPEHYCLLRNSITRAFAAKVMSAGMQPAVDKTWVAGLAGELTGEGRKNLSDQYVSDNVWLNTPTAWPVEDTTILLPLH